MISRRNFIKNTAGILIAAPMVVRAESIMKVNPLDSDTLVWRAVKLPIADDFSGMAYAPLTSLTRQQAQAIYNHQLRSILDSI